MSKKRKHEQVQDQDDANDTKPQSNENTSSVPTKSKGELRQEKSERRAKKLKKSKDQENEAAGTDTAGLDDTSKPKSKLKSEKKEKKSKKSKVDDTVDELQPTVDTVPTPDLEGKAIKKEKKKSKNSKVVDADDETQPTSDTAPKPDLEGKALKKEKKSKKAAQEEDTTDTKSAPARFIVFVGNLPYNATVEQLSAHFSKITPTSIRQSTDQVTGKGKGFAFLEFDHYDKMKTCLKLYHHSIFDPDAREKGQDGQDDTDQKSGKKSTGRRINVELTAGGGGKSKERKAKLKSKNQKLEEERERRRLKDKAEREKAGPKEKKSIETGANATAVKDQRGDIHPSRLARVSH